MDPISNTKKVLVITLGLLSFLVTSNTVHGQGAAQEISYDAEYARTKHTTIKQEILRGQNCVLKEPYVSRNPFKSNDYRIEAIPPPYEPVTGADQPTVTPGVDLWTGGGIDTIWYCPPGILDKLRDENGGFSGEITKADEDPVSTGEQIAIMIIGRLFWVFGVVGSWFIYIAGQLLTPLLTVKSFITNPLVTKGWPFVQGLANIGFILAMLFIAATTTLRIETFNARRMIPRLLIAALLINFSLVIGGVLIDSSRLVMAVLVRTMTSANISTLGKSILDSSHLIQGAYDTNNLGLVGLKTGAQSWSWLKGVALSTIMIWAVGVSFMVITIGLLIRYIMLILLLIVSPIAYLAFALPKAEGVARSWWKNFLKYVIYGPVALFTLSLIVVVGDMYADGKNALGNTANGSTIDTLIQIIVVCALAVGAALAGKQLGTTGAASTVGFVKNRTTQAARVGGRIAVGGVAGTAGIISRTTGAGDFVQETKAGLKNTRVGKLFTGPKRKKDGSLEEGQSTAGSRLGKSLFTSAKDRQTQQKARAVSEKSVKQTLSLADAEKDPNRKAMYGETAVEQVYRDAGIDQNNKAEVIEHLSDPNFVLNIPPSAFDALLKYGSQDEKKTIGAALSTSDTGTITPENRKRLTQSVVNEAAESGDTTIVKNIVSNPAFAKTMSSSDQAKVLAIGDDKTTDRLVKAIRSSKQE